MGSGNKDKRRRERGQGEPSGEKPPEAAGSRGRGGFSEDPDAGVSFEIESDADRIFREAVEGMAGSEGAKQDDEFLDAMGREEAGRGGRRGAGMRSEEVDLHRLTIAEASAAVDAAISSLVAGLRGEAVMTVITGKGVHSGPGGGVLGKEIHRHVKQKWSEWIIAIEEAPGVVKLGGVPIRGHFKVRFRGR